MKRLSRWLLLFSLPFWCTLANRVYASYAGLKIEVIQSTNVTKGAAFQVRVMACDNTGNQLTPADPDWAYASRAYIYYQCSDPAAKIKDNLGNFISINEFNNSDPRLWMAERTDTFVLETVGLQVILVREKNVLGIEPGSIDLRVYKWVDRFQITLVDPGAGRTAGEPFDIEIRALDEDGNLAKSFNDDIAIWAIVWPEDYKEPTMVPSTIPGSSFSGGKATVSVIIYGSHPTTRNVKIKCENTVMHGQPPYYATGTSGYFSIMPTSYANVLLIAPGEEYRPGTLGGGGKESLPTDQTAGRPFEVKVYTVDAYWNPVLPVPNVTVQFASSDPRAELPSPPETIMNVNPKAFSVTLKTVSGGNQSITVSEGTKNSVSMISLRPGETSRFGFMNIPSPQKTTDPFAIRITAYDEFDNVADYDQEATLGTSYGPDYISPKTARFTNGIANLSVQVTRAGNRFKISVSDGMHTDWSNEFDVRTGPLSKLLVLLEGETPTPGISPGRSGAPRSVYAGQVTTATIYACDSWWNPTLDDITVTFGSSTGYIEAPASLFLDDGYGKCLVKFRTAYEPTTRLDEAQRLTVTGAGLSGTSSPITVVPGAYEKIILVAPGEMLDPGTFDLDGKSGAPSDRVAGSAFTLTVAVTDAYGNPVTAGFPATVTFTSGDTHPDVRFGNALPGTGLSMATRIKDFSNCVLVTLANPQWVRVTASDGKSSQVNMRVVHAALDHFTFSAIPATLTAGTTVFGVTIVAQDKYNNTVENFNSVAALEASTGANTYVPATAPFANGRCVLNVTVYKAQAGVTLTCRSGAVSGTSNSFDINPGPYAKLILLLPGETHCPGNIVVQGKSGTPSPYTVGNPPLETKVYAVDQYWNKVPTAAGRIRVNSQNPSHYLDVEPSNIQDLISGQVTFWTRLRTAAPGQVLVAEDVNNGFTNTSTINVNPGSFVKLQILAPGEEPVPGSDLGKTGRVCRQIAGVSFDLVVRAVDQYWNLVPTVNGESIDLISSKDPGLDARYSPKPFVGGIINYNVWLNGDNQDIDVTAINLSPPPFVEQHTVYVHIDRGYRYVIQVPTYTIAGTLSTNVFPMTVKLVNESNDVVTDAQNYFEMVPYLADDYSPATDPDGLGVKTYKLTNGVATFNQSYTTVEKICIAVSDEFGRGPVYSSAIDVRETGLTYRIDVPDQTSAGSVFEMTVSLIDIGTGRVVPTRDRQVALVPVSSAQPGREGSLFVTSVGLSRGTWKISNQWYTKAEIVSIRASDKGVCDSPAQPNSSLPFKVLPGPPKKLRILAPGEEPRPGEVGYSGSGKDSSKIQVQGTEIDFPVTVQVVDEYWNLIDNFSGGSVYLFSDGSFTSEPNETIFTCGMASFVVTIHQGGSSFTLGAKARSPSSLDPQLVVIPMEAAVYQITTTVLGARTIDRFKLIVELVDPNTGLVKSGANNKFTLTPCTVDCKPASGNCTVVGLQELYDGKRELWVSYDTVEKIRFKVSDVFGRPPAYSDPIEIRPAGLRYELECPEKAEAGKEFPVTVKLIDTGAGKVVTAKEYGRQVKLSAYSSTYGLPAEGELRKDTFYLGSGIATVPVTYSLAETIFIEASDGGDYSPRSQPARTADIEVTGAPETVMKLEGVYHKVNDAIYVRELTLISLQCISDIKAEKIYYRDNGSEWRTYDKPFTLSPGAHVIEYYAVDKYGNKEKIRRSQTIYVSFFDSSAGGVINRPNPFRAGKENTFIEYNLKEPSNVTITIYDQFGQEVWRKNYREGERGGSRVNSEPWDGRNLAGHVVGNGGYICRIWIEKEKRAILRKIAVIK